MTSGTKHEREAVLLRDGEGNAFLIPRDLVERYLVPAEHAAELRDLLEQADGDTQGYAGPVQANIVTLGPQLADLSRFFDERYVLRFNPLKPDPAPAP